jgi:RNA polymerase-binding transcription factor DksA
MSGARPGGKNGGMKTFSDDTLRDAREKLLARGVLLRDRLQCVQADLHRSNEPSPVGTVEEGKVRESAEVLLAIEKSDCAELARINTALEHTEDDTFGLCEECGREIEAERFIAIPSTTHCKACRPGP